MNRALEDNKGFWSRMRWNLDCVEQEDESIGYANVSARLNESALLTFLVAYFMFSTFHFM